MRPVDAAVRTKGLGHSYVKGHEVLDGVDLDIAPGTRVALVGASGAGKTTLAKLVTGVHRPARGTVDIGGATLDEQGPVIVRETVALITQEVHVFAGSLAEDLRLAKPNATDQELRGRAGRRRRPELGRGTARRATGPTTSSSRRGRYAQLWAAWSDTRCADWTELISRPMPVPRPR